MNPANNIVTLGGSIPSAAGYQNYSNLLNPIFVDDLITRYYARTLGGRICAQDIVPTTLRNMGDTVIYRRTPRAKIHRYTKNQILEKDGLNTVSINMQVNRGVYYNLDIDDVDQHQIANIDTWVDGFKYDAVERVAMTVDVELMDTIAMQAHPLNRGTCAGAMSRGYNMGAMGKPVDLSGNNILDTLNDASAVLSEANVDFADRYIVLPVAAQPVLAGTDVLRNALNSGLPRSMQLVGMQAYNDPIAGFSNVYFSNLLPRRWDPVAQKYAYACIFGRKDATGFVTQIAKNEFIPVKESTFGSSWRALYVYGMKVLRPEAVGVLYASFTKKAA